MKKEIMISFKLSQEELDMLNRDSKANGMGKSAWLRYLIRSNTGRMLQNGVVGKNVKEAK